MSSDRDLRVRILLNAMDKASGPLKAIKEESRKAGAELRATTHELDRLEKAQSDLKGFRELKRGLKATGAELEDARGKASRLAAEIDRTDKPTKRMAAEFARAKREAADLGRKFDAQRQSLQQTRDRLAAVGVSTRNLVDDERKLGRQVSETNGKLATQRQRFAELQRSAPDRIARAGVETKVDRDIADRRAARRERFVGGAKGAAAAGISAAGVAVTAAGVDAVVGAANFESSLTSIGQKASMTRREMTAMGIVFDRWGPKLGTSPTDLASGVDMLASKGLPNRQLLPAIRPIAKTAAAYKSEIPDISDGAFAALNNLEVPLNQLTRTLEIMAAGDEKGAFGVEDMARAFPALTASVQALGQRGTPAVADIVAALEVVRPAAATSDIAANNLGNLIDKIYAKETIENFSKVKIDLVAEMKKAKAAGKTPIEAVAGITNKAVKGDLTKLSYFFGDKQAQDALRPLITNLSKYRQMRDQVAKSEGAIDRAFAERQKDTAAKWVRLGANWEAGQHTEGRQQRPRVNGLLDWANSWFEKSKPAPAGSKAAPVQSAGGKTVERIKAGNPQGKAMIAAMAAANARAEAEQRAAQARMIAEADRFRADIKARYGNRSDFVGIGANLMLGIEAGINTRAAGLRAQIIGMSARIKAWFRGDMKIKSPSRVFAEYGRFITAGLADGIERGGASPVASVRRVAGRVAAAGMTVAAPVPALALAGPSAAPASAGGSRAKAAPIVTYQNTYQIRIEGTGDVRTQARQLMAEIKRIEQNDRNSSLGDD